MTEKTKEVPSAVERIVDPTTVDAPSLFDAWRAWNAADWAMYERICAIFESARPDDFIEDIAHDEYDASLEIYSSEDIVPTREQADAVLAMGFAKFWINFPDETEIVCGPTSIGERKKRSYEKWRSGGRKCAPSSTAPSNGGLVAWSDALLIIQRGMDAYKVKHPKWWKRMDGTPILNDLPVVIAEVVAQELHYPPHRTKDQRPCVYPIGLTTCGYPEDEAMHEGSNKPAPPDGRHPYTPTAQPSATGRIAAEATGDFYCEGEQLRSSLKCQRPCDKCWGSQNG